MNSIRKNFLNNNLEKKLTSLKFEVEKKEFGKVFEIKDNIVKAIGLKNVSYGEIVEFENGERGYVIDLTEKEVGIIVLGDYVNIKVNDLVYRTNLPLSIAVSNEIIGRVINPLGQPLDGEENYKIDKYYPLEKIAPGVIYRKPVDEPLQTGIKMIDALIPIGRGQRELIIGDRGTGKTTIAVDTIINQKNENVICIYCAIGQRRSKIASVIDLFKNFGVLDYTIVVSASASDPVSLQYLAPYSACAIGEYFMDQGKDVLVVYDDLTKHAWAYRQISLILRRPAGREAYPGDIFYLHSRLLERACRLDKKYGGGSLTALPIIETLEGDVSAYIPTNVISITDGQIFLENDLFNAGIRPAINIGISVSRVGGKAQTSAMKKVAGKLKLDLAQYREISAFSQFESELDEETKRFLNRGARLTKFLIQKSNNPYSLPIQIALIWAANSPLLENFPLKKIPLFEEKFISLISNEKEGKKLINNISKTKNISENDELLLENFVKKILKIMEIE